MIVSETITYKLNDGDIRKLLSIRTRDAIRSIDVQTTTSGRPVRVDVVVDRPSKGRWFKKVRIGR